MTTRMILAALALSLGTTGAALANDDCHVPMERWQAPGAIVTLAEEQGWQIERLKIDDGCYEVRGTDAEGRRFKVKLDPETLEVVKFEWRDRHRDRRDRDRTRSSEEIDAPPANGLFEEGSTSVATTD